MENLIPCEITGWHCLSKVQADEHQFFAQAYWFFAAKIVIEQISTKSVKSGCPHFPTIKWRCSEMFVILPKFSCYLCLSDLELKKYRPSPGEQRALPSPKVVDPANRQRQPGAG